MATMLFFSIQIIHLIKADMSLVTLSFTYQTTGISQIEDIKKALQGKVYNLLGQCVGSFPFQGLSKGVYIINGKKVIIK